MPAPSKEAMALSIKTALLSEMDMDPTSPSFGKPIYCKREIDEDGNMIFDTSKLMPAMEKMMDLIAQGITVQWAIWQSTQTIVANDTITGAPVIGSPGVCLP